ncbi:conserved hypothetical protein [Planctopirus limnophila DSM 3776]|uniref:Uncharacterized protein n=1 Tax=Planctopirus limnophila (strain ATCC 43296 / DSM 3776 / IFAM 1008 / Mu 290) TaxID=521674 RepID=D5STS0_PLAL2|nr:SIR2 family protein [Planctopirus limnophila]ADG66905.1 conserved hypothetical protein [Planctopirus limnophila DSM 3776]
MDASSDVPQLGLDDFARRFALRAKNLMWMLGAGASASAGIPTASDMIWEFKQRLFVSQRRVSPQTVADLSNSVVRAQLQAHIDSSGQLASAGSPEEYASLFESVYPAETDRRAYLDSKLNGAKPSVGHLAIATLMQSDLTRILWTTNFDSLVADACAKVYGNTGALATVGLDAPEVATQLVGDQRWPIEIKLHGDFRSRRLKNTDDELRHQDVRLRQLLVECCRRFGLVVAGYSGRDDSIMDALEEAVTSGAFPAGLFWLQRGDGRPLPRVEQLLRHAMASNIEVALIPIENFDETLRDVTRLLEGIDTKVLDAFSSERRHWSGAPPPTGRMGWPVVRFNALPIQTPTVCRRVVCEIGGHAEVADAVKQVGVNVLVGRVSSGVLAFGQDSEIRQAFSNHAISEFDLHTIEKARLRYDSGERGLLRAALTTALVRERGLDAFRHRRADLLAPQNPSDPRWARLKALTGSISGSVPRDSELTWREGIGVRLDWAEERLWVLIEPRVVFVGMTEANRAAATDFARERTVKRYNRQLNDVIEFWAKYLEGDGIEIRALGIGNGVDATFSIGSETAYSRRLSP